MSSSGEAERREDYNAQHDEARSGGQFGGRREVTPSGMRSLSSNVSPLARAAVEEHVTVLHLFFDEDGAWFPPAPRRRRWT
jgi:hypothetical protein